jgi:hypothetical protein
MLTQLLGGLPQHGPVVADFSLLSPGFILRAVHVGFMLDSVPLQRVFLAVLRFPLSLSSHRCTVFIYVSCGGWTVGPLPAHFQRDIVSPHRNSIINNCVIRVNWKSIFSLQAVLTIQLCSAGSILNVIRDLGGQETDCVYGTLVYIAVFSRVCR